MVAGIVDFPFIIELCDSIMTSIWHLLNAHLFERKSIHVEVVMTRSLNVVFIEDIRGRSTTKPEFGLPAVEVVL